MHTQLNVVVFNDSSENFIIILGNNGEKSPSVIKTISSSAFTTFKEILLSPLKGAKNGHSIPLDTEKNEHGKITNK